MRLTGIGKKKIWGPSLRRREPQAAIVLLRALLIVTVSVPNSHAASPGWKPSKNVEIIVPTNPGGGQDRAMRAIQRVLHEKKILGVSSVVVNKPGGGGTIGLAYLNSYPGDGHYLFTATLNTLVTNKITGVSTLDYTDFTLINRIIDEYPVFAVKAVSPIKTGKDLVETLKRDPQAVSFSVSTARSGTNNISACLLGQATGIECNRMKIVVFNSGAESKTAVLGGHIDVAVQTAGNFVSELKEGTMRAIGVTSAQRLKGVFADIPTWREQGVDAVVTSWRVLIGPKGMNQDQLTFWQDVFVRLVKTEEWKKEEEINFFESNLAGPEETLKFLKTEYDKSKIVLTGLGLAKK